MLRFAVNHMTVANASYQALLDTAVSCGCAGVEVRNDLDGDLFDGVDPVEAGRMAKDRGLRILALAEVKAFNRFSDNVMAQVEALAATAVACGAEGISLIPCNDGGADVSSHGDQRRQLIGALQEIHPVLERNNLLGFIEPLGFSTATLRHKVDAVDAIEAVGSARFKIVHDTFHHYLASGDSSIPETVFAEHTGIVHVSGVINAELTAATMADEHRVLVDANDRLGNAQQLAQLLEAGYSGPVSVEAFAPSVHAITHPAAALQSSFNYIESEVNAVTA